jgi:DNA-binding beta-propeller fold protein YncE
MERCTVLSRLRSPRAPRMARTWRAGMRILLAAAACASAGCALPPPDVAPRGTPAQALAWPKPPAAARVRYVRSIATPADWGISPSLLDRVVEAFTGSLNLHFVRPTGVAERAGVLFVADPGAQALFIFDAEQGRAQLVNRVGDDALVSPVALALGPADTVFVADSALKRILVVDRNGRVERTVANPILVRPAGVAYDPIADRLYVADSGAHHVVVFSASGQLIQTFGTKGSGEGQFNSPTHLTLTPERQLLVTDALNFRVQAFDATGQFLWKIGRVGVGSGDFAAPKGVAADDAGHVYVVDALFDAVQIFAHDGSLLLGFGERGTTPGRFWLPGGIFMGSRDTIYVADSYNQRIQVFQRIPERGPQSASTPLPP